MNVSFCLQHLHVPLHFMYSFIRSSARQHYMQSALYAIARPSLCPSVRPSVTRVDQSKTVQVRIMQLSPQSCPIPLVFAV